MRRSVSPFTFTSLVVGVTALMIFLSPFSVCQNPALNVLGTPPGWSGDIPLCNYTVTNQYCSIATSGNEIFVIWRHNYTDLVFSKSQDNGLTWNPFISIYHNSAGTVLYDDIGTSGLNVHTVVGDFQGWDGIYYRNSTNGGETWNSVRRISSDSVDAAGPLLYVNNSNIHIIWLDYRDGSNGEIYYRRSLDGGITFDNGQGIDEDRRITFSPALIGGISIAGDESTISVSWSDERDGDLEKSWMISKNNGYTWENGLGAENEGRKLTDDTTDCGGGAITVSESNIHIIWEDESWPGPEYRLYYRNSTDNGLTWNPIQLLTGPVPGINSPDIDVQGNNISVVWDDERDDGSHEQIYYKNSSDGGITWSQDTRLNYNISRSSYWPRISMENDTKHVVWWDQIANPNHQVMYKRSPDFPDLSPPSHSNEIPLPDSYKDAPGTNISVHVTDPSGVNASAIQLRVNGSLVPHISIPIADGYNVSWASGGFGPGLVTCRIVAEDMLGNVLDYTWNFTVLANYIILLQPAWNLISLPLEQVDTSVPSVLASIDGQYDDVKYYDTLDKNDPWKSYRPGSSVNDLTGIDNTMGFWIHASQFCNLTARGIVRASTQITLSADWNLVGYPTQTTETVGNALWGTGADRVEVFNSTSPYYVKEVGATYLMKPGEGYWVHVTADTTWIINW